MKVSHATVITGYVIINGKAWFVVQDPLPEGEGNTILMSYEKLCCGANHHESEYGDDGYWWGFVAVNTEYIDQTIPWNRPND